jgi:hypothetical protein
MASMFRTIGGSCIFAIFLVARFDGAAAQPFQQTTTAQCVVQIQGQNIKIEGSVDVCSGTTKISVIASRNIEDQKADYCIGESSGVQQAARKCSLHLNYEMSLGQDPNRRWYETERERKERETWVYGRYTGEVLFDSNTKTGRPHGRGTLRVTKSTLDLAMIARGESTSEAITFDGHWDSGNFTGSGQILMRDGGYLKGRFFKSVLMEGNAYNVSDSNYGLETRLNRNTVYTGSVSRGALHGRGEVRSTSTSIIFLQQGEFRDGFFWNGTFEYEHQGKEWVTEWRDNRQVTKRPK